MPASTRTAAAAAQQKEVWTTKTTTTTTTTSKKGAADSDATQSPSSAMSADLFRGVAVVLAQLWVLRAVNNESKDEYDPFSKCSAYLPLGVTIFYLVALKVGTMLMRNREAFVLKESMIVYNLYQTCFNAWVVFAFAREIYQQGLYPYNNMIDRSPKGFRLGFLIFAHYNNKYLELFDTLFMVLRKKNDQISFLHVYHHTLLIWSWFIVVRTWCGGDAYFGALANSIIHVVMYGYYLWRLLVKAPCPWKRYVTMLQLAQFCIVLTQSMGVLYHGSSPRWLTGLQIFVMLNMLVLFGNFYRKSYKKKSA